MQWGRGMLLSNSAWPSDADPTARFRPFSSRATSTSEQTQRRRQETLEPNLAAGFESQRGRENNFCVPDRMLEKQRAGCCWGCV